MKKIISLFQRNYGGDHLVRDEVVPGAEWVLAGKGVATQKYDGSCCAIINGKLYKRREYKTGVQSEPANFILVNIDEKTGKRAGWLPVGDGPEDRWFREAFDGTARPDGTYELLGPKVQGNPEKSPIHFLLLHSDAVVFEDCPRDFESLKSWFADKDIEGIVWHHPDGRMVKIKKRDFGLTRRPEA